MKYIVFSFYFIIFTACTTPNKNIIQNSSNNTIIKKPEYFALEEYKYKNFSEKDDETLKLLENKKIYDYAVQKNTIVLKRTYTSFYELLQNKNFFHNHFIDKQPYKNFNKLIYHKNKALIYFSGKSLDRQTLCVFSAYYLLTLNKNKISVTYISGGHGEILLMGEELAKYTSSKL